MFSTFGIKPFVAGGAAAVAPGVHPYQLAQTGLGATIIVSGTKCTSYADLS